MMVVAGGLTAPVWFIDLGRSFHRLSSSTLINEYYVVLMTSLTPPPPNFESFKREDNMVFERVSCPCICPRFHILSIYTDGPLTCPRFAVVWKSDADSSPELHPFSQVDSEERSTLCVEPRPDWCVRCAIFEYSRPEFNDVQNPSSQPLTKVSRASTNLL